MSSAKQRFRLNARLALFILLIVSVLLLAVSTNRGRHLALGVHTLHADDQAMQQVHDLGAMYVVQVFSWREIEPSPGEFHWEYTDWLVRAADYYDLRVLARLDQPPNWAAVSTSGLSAPPRRADDYGDFVARVAERYRSRVAAYIIWNEPNLAREWGSARPDPAAYAALLKTAATRIRAADPDARIVSAGLAPTNENSAQALDDREFLQALYAAGARDSFEILGAHPYGFTQPPADPRGAHDGLNLARIQDLRDIMVANGDSAKPVWITEFGYTTNPPPENASLRVSETDQAQYLTRAYELVRAQWDWVQLFTVWNISHEIPTSDNASEQAGYSIVHAGGTLKLAFDSLRAMPKESLTQNLALRLSGLFASFPQPREFPVLARDAWVHLGDSEYPLPWVPLYKTRNPSTEWTGEFYLRASDLSAERRAGDWTLTLELMQVNDFDTRVLVDGQPTLPPFLPTEDFTSMWVTAQLRVPATALHVGRNTVTVRDGKLFPAFQQLGFTWDDFQFRNVILTPPN